MTEEQKTVTLDALRGYAWCVTAVNKMAYDGTLTKEQAVVIQTKICMNFLEVVFP